MEFNGVAVDKAMLAEQSLAMGQRIDALRSQVVAAAGVEFNPDSPKQLADVLFNKLGLKVVKKKKTGPSTDVEVLEALVDQSDVCRLMLEYRMLVKLKNTYLDNLPEYISPRTGRIHPSFSQIGAETGRLSCSDPNLQNIPIRSEEGRRIRLAFVPGDPEHNVLLTADYSQIELRMLAHFTQEPGLVQAFANDEDIHKAVAAEVYGVSVEQVSREQRSSAKTINFGIIYGVSAWGLAKRIEGLSVDAAEKLIQAYHARFPGIQQFMDQSIRQAQTQGYVETILGRRRPILDIHSGVARLSSAAQRSAANTVIQGSAADLIKMAMLRVYRKLQAKKRPSKLLLQVHDELVFETPMSALKEDAALIEQEMVQAMELRVPLKVDIGSGKNWQEGK
jgi:DNA polymerase-1